MDYTLQPLEWLGDLASTYLLPELVALDTFFPLRPNEHGSCGVSLQGSHQSRPLQYLGQTALF